MNEESEHKFFSNKSDVASSMKRRIDYETEKQANSCVLRNSSRPFSLLIVFKGVANPIEVHVLNAT